MNVAAVDDWETQPTPARMGTAAGDSIRADTPWGTSVQLFRRIKWGVRLLVYPAITLLIPADYFFLGLSWEEAIMSHLGGYLVATLGIEIAFWFIFKLRKRTAYASMLATEVGATRDFGQACHRAVRVVAELLDVEKVVLAWGNPSDTSLTTVATHGIPPEDVPLTTPLPWCQRAVKQAMEEREVVLTSASEGRAWLSGSDGHSRVALVPLLSLDRFVGLLILVGGRKASDLQDKGLLAITGPAIGLTLDNLHHSSELRQMATHDELTQLFNRRHFFEQLENELTDAQHSGRPLSLLMLDVDGLKLINDTYGHSIGDKVLANFGKLLAKRVRAEELPARIGGDEFAVLMPNTDKRGALAAAARLERTLKSKPICEAEGLELRLSISCGVASYPWSGETVADIVQQADANMYGMKATRKGRSRAATTPRRERHFRSAKALQ
ncbi:MAG: GGDEF domain-containing protein [Dehalococcoidia bacterium]|nr:GGDEF domain-containing protein [Dehalococcoidia bacterium]